MIKVLGFQNPEIEEKLFFRNIPTNNNILSLINDNKRVPCRTLFNSFPFFFPLIRIAKASTRFHSNRIETKTQLQRLFRNHDSNPHMWTLYLYIYSVFFCDCACSCVKKKNCIGGKSQKWRVIIILFRLMHLISAYFNEYIISCIYLGYRSE